MLGWFVMQQYITDTETKMSPGKPNVLKMGDMNMHWFCSRIMVENEIEE